MFVGFRSLRTCGTLTVLIYYRIQQLFTSPNYIFYRFSRPSSPSLPGSEGVSQTLRDRTGVMSTLNEEDLTLTVPPNGSMSLWQFSYVNGWTTCAAVQVQQIDQVDRTSNREPSPSQQMVLRKRMNWTVQ